MSATPATTSTPTPTAAATATTAPSTPSTPSTPSNAPNLTTLPLELLELIISHLPTAKDVASLSSTCKSYNHLIRSHGWGIFVTHWFQPQARECLRKQQQKVERIDWFKTANQLTTLSKSWYQRSFQLRLLEPPLVLHAIPSSLTTWIDVVEEESNGNWRDESLVMAFGHGGTLIRRKRQVFARGLAPFEEWKVYECNKERGDDEGDPARNSITALKILDRDSSFLKSFYSKEGEDENDDEEDDEVPFADRIFIGKHHSMELVELGDSSQNFDKRRKVPRKTIKEYKTLVRYDMEDGVSCASSVSPAQDVLIAALEGCKNTVPQLVIYPLYPSTIDIEESRTQVRLRTEADSRNDGESILIPAVDKFTPEGMCTERIDFLSNDRFAVLNSKMKGPSGSLIQVYRLSNERSFRQDPEWQLPSLTGKGLLPKTPLCVVKLPDGAYSDRRTGSTGRLFLSGWSDGKIRLYDLRAPPSDPAQTFTDHYQENTYITSLATIGFERFAASTSNTATVRIHDLRMPGQKAYCYRDASRSSREAGGPTYIDHTVWGTGVLPKEVFYPSNPILCTGSSFGKSLYIGLTRGRVAEMDFWDNQRLESEYIYEAGLTGYAFNQSTGILRGLDYSTEQSRLCGRSIYEGSLGSQDESENMFSYPDSPGHTNTGRIINRISRFFRRSRPRGT